jgi:hypothetical protein
MRTGTIAEIRTIENGFVVCVDDPVVRKANRNPKVPYKDPEKEYSFPTIEKALAWIKANVKNLTPEVDDEDEYKSSFTRATIGDAL